MCINPLNPATCPELGILIPGITDVPKAVGNSIVESVIAGMASAFEVAVEWVARLLTLWVLVPSSDLCPAGGNPQNWSADWVQQCNNADMPAQQLRGFLLPITVFVACGGLLWQAIQIVLTRKGEPLMQAVRGIWNTALWTGIGIAGTHALLKAGDSYSMWILNEAIFSKSSKPPNEAMSAALVAMLVPSAAATGGAIAPIVMILVSLVVLLVTLFQVILMVFREGSVVILAGVTQLAAAGSITKGTSGWQQKVVSWGLALATYKAAAATVYAACFAMMGGKPRDFIMGIAMLGLSIIALPVLLKFFTFFTGSIASAGGAAGMAGAGAAAGVHAASSLRGAIGGNTAGEHARYMDGNGPGSGGNGGGGAGNAGPSGATPTPPSPGPGGSVGGGAQPGKVMDGQAGPASGDATPRTTTQVNVPAGTGATAPSTGAATGAGATAGAGGAGAGGAAAGGAGAGGAAAGAAGGPIGLAAVAVVEGGKMAAGAAKQGAAAASSAMDEGGSR